MSASDVLFSLSLTIGVYVGIPFLIALKKNWSLTPRQCKWLVIINGIVGSFLFNFLNLLLTGYVDSNATPALFWSWIAYMIIKRICNPSFDSPYETSKDSAQSAAQKTQENIASVSSPIFRDVPDPTQDKPVKDKPYMKAYFSKFIKSPAAAASGKIKNCLAKLIKSPVAVVSVVAVVVFALGLWIGSGFTANDHATNLQSQAPQSAASTNVSPSSVSTPKHSATQWVWVVTTGARYHLTPECSNMKTPIQIGLDEAVGLGYTPCKNCC